MVQRKVTRNLFLVLALLAATAFLATCSSPLQSRAGTADGLLASRSVSASTGTLVTTSPDKKGRLTPP